MGLAVDGVCFEAISTEWLLIGNKGNPLRYLLSETILFGASLFLNSACLIIFISSLYAVTPIIVNHLI